MEPSRFLFHAALPALVGLLNISCSEPRERTDLQAAAGAALGVEKDKETKALDEKQAAERRAAFQERKAKEDAHAAKLAKLNADLVGLPEKLPADLASACADLVELYPDWVLATDADAKQEKLVRDDIATEPVQNECAKLKHRDAAACMIHVVQRVIAPDFPEADRQLITDTPGFLYNECTSKYDK